MTAKSAIFLAYYLVKRLLVRCFFARNGFRAFERQYIHGEGLIPVKPEERSPALFSCVACGACDVAAVRRLNGSRPAVYPSAFALGYARSWLDADAATGAARAMRRLDLEELERICPTSVPFRQLVDVVEKKADELLNAATNESFRHVQRSP